MLIPFYSGKRIPSQQKKCNIQKVSKKGTVLFIISLNIFQFDFGGSPVPSIIKGSLEAEDMRIFFGDAVNDRPEGSGPFAMDNANMKNALATAFP